MQPELTHKPAGDKLKNTKNLQLTDPPKKIIKVTLPFLNDRWLHLFKILHQSYFFYALLKEMLSKQLKTKTSFQSSSKDTGEGI